MSSSHPNNIIDPLGCGSFLLNFANKIDICTILAQKQIAWLKWAFGDPEPTRNSKRCVLTHFSAFYYLSWRLFRPEPTKNIFITPFWLKKKKKHTKGSSIFEGPCLSQLLRVWYSSFVFRYPTKLSQTSDFLFILTSYMALKYNRLKMTFPLTSS